MKKLLIMAVAAFQAQAFASTPTPATGAIEDFENVAARPPVLTLDLPGMTIDSYYNGDLEVQRPMLAIENDAASSLKGHHLVLRTEYLPVSDWHDTGFWLRPKGEANGIRFRLEANRASEQTMTLSCRSVDGIEYVNVWLPEKGDVAAYCPRSKHLSFVQFFAVGKELVFRFDDVELR